MNQEIAPVTRLITRLMLQALSVYKATFGPTEVILHRQIDEATWFFTHNATFEQMSKNGGLHLAAMRQWIQERAINGERVEWGTEQVVQLPPLSVRDLEHLACRIGAAAVNDAKGF
jgi:hypothetical protein